MMNLLQTPYRAVMNLFYQATKHIGDRMKNAGILVCCFCMAIYFPLSYSKLLPHFMGDENYRMLWICILVALIAVFGIRKQIRQVRWNVPFLIVYYLFAVSLLIARYHHGLRAGTVLFSLFLIILLPCYCLVWNSHEQYALLFDRLAFAVTVVNLLFYAASVAVWPYIYNMYVDGRYTGLTTNPNIMAMVCLMSVITGCYLICRGRCSVLAAAGAGAGFGFLYLTTSRTAILAAAFVVIAAVISWLRERDVNRIGEARLVIVILVVVIAAAGSVWLAKLPAKQFSYHGIESLQEKTDSDSKFTLEECINNHISLEAAAGEASGEAGQLPGAPGGAPVQTEQVAQAGDGAGSRFQKQDNTNAFSSGRLEVYRWVLQHTTVWGTDLDEHPVVIDGSSVGGTHNAILNFTYQCGWHGGILFLLIEIMTAVFLIRFCFGKKEYPEGTLFAALIIAAFMIEANLENQTLPSVRDLACYYYMIMPVMFLRKYHLLRGKTDSESDC